MDRNKIDKLHESQLEILKEVDLTCQKLGINYYLAFGSLLGAVRHQGSIPWDADIDIVLVRDDYEALKDYYLHNDINSKFVYIDYTLDPHHLSPHALLINKDTHIIGNPNSHILFPRKYDGVYIDIFPLDRTSNKRFKQVVQANTIKTIRYLLSLKNPVIHYGKNWNYKQVLKIILSYCLKPITFKFLGFLLELEMKKYDSKDCDCFVIPTHESGFDKIVPFDYYYPPKRVKYEDTIVSIPSKSKEILTITYGDYLELPPEDERWLYLDTHISTVIYEDGLEA